MEKEKLKNTTLENKVDQQTEAIIREKEHSKQLQNLVYELFTYSNEAGNGMKNLINTGKSRTNRVQLALERVFDDPISFLDAKFEHQEPKKDNVISLFEEEYDL